MVLLVATDNGLFMPEHASGVWAMRQCGLAGMEVSSVIAREGVILAGGSDGRPRFGSPAPGIVYPDVHSIEVRPSRAWSLCFYRALWEI